MIRAIQVKIQCKNKFNVNYPFCRSCAGAVPDIDANEITLNRLECVMHQISAKKGRLSQPKHCLSFYMYQSDLHTAALLWPADVIA